jgi:hypothetical protein
LASKKVLSPLRRGQADRYKNAMETLKTLDAFRLHFAAELQRLPGLSENERHHAVERLSEFFHNSAAVARLYKKGITADDGVLALAANANAVFGILRADGTRMDEVTALYVHSPLLMRVEAPNIGKRIKAVAYTLRQGSFPVKGVRKPDNTAEALHRFFETQGLHLLLTRRTKMIYTIGLHSAITGSNVHTSRAITEALRVSDIWKGLDAVSAEDWPTLALKAGFKPYGPRRGIGTAEGFLHRRAKLAGSTRG